MGVELSSALRFAIKSRLFTSTSENVLPAYSSTLMYGGTIWIIGSNWFVPGVERRIGVAGVVDRAWSIATRER